MESTPTLATINTRPNIFEPGDDWTGVTNQSKRKKLQNRLNQRAYRQYILAEQYCPSQLSLNCLTILHPIEDVDKSCNEAIRDEVQQGTSIVPSEGARYGTDSKIADLFEGCVLLTCPRRIRHISGLIRQAYEDYSLHAPRPTYLQILIRLNVLNGLARNAVCIGFPPEGLCRDEAISPYSTDGPQRHNSPRPATSCPSALQPTFLQTTVVHHPWIDLLPFPQLRDNILMDMEVGLLNDDELCEDLLVVDDPRDLANKPSLIVWGESWDTRAWEANPAFLRKWGFQLRGCTEILVATNYWREKRGEKRLIFEPGDL
ncbi:aryl-alcohol dehydrogenase [Fusarium sporotrichioides]|uniref:Aryl-alcohol dehydrogenase n=1 Tax=Fusarium sporotrichioides TaxID=5514 RepID=A0A395RUC5_FUSSP|nr:aryl-alcohol dehydrogenase [Fusarium sporotrichioides]